MNKESPLIRAQLVRIHSNYDYIKKHYRDVQVSLPDLVSIAGIMQDIVEGMMEAVDRIESKQDDRRKNGEPLAYKVEVKGEPCVTKFARYDNHRHAIVLVHAETGEPMYKATVNVPDIHLAVDEIIVKSYAENEGVLMALIDAGVIGSGTTIYSSGHATIHKARLLPKVVKELRDAA